MYKFVTYETLHNCFYLEKCDIQILLRRKKRNIYILLIITFVMYTFFQCKFSNKYILYLYTSYHTVCMYVYISTKKYYPQERCLHKGCKQADRFLQICVNIVRIWLVSLKVHMHEILQFVFHIFLASFKNRQGRGPEYQKFCTVKC